MSFLVAILQTSGEFQKIIILFILFWIDFHKRSQQHMPITVSSIPNLPCQLSLWEDTGVPGVKTIVDFYSLSYCVRPRLCFDAFALLETNLGIASVY